MRVKRPSFGKKLRFQQVCCGFFAILSTKIHKNMIIEFWAEVSLSFFEPWVFLGLSFLENVKKQACSKCQILTVGVQGVRRHSYCRGWEQKTKGPLHTLGVVSVQVVLSQLKMPNLNCWGPGESIDTHIVGVGNKKDKVTSACKGPQCPWGPGSAQNVPFRFPGSRGIQRCPYSRVLWKKWM